MSKKPGATIGLGRDRRASRSSPGVREPLSLQQRKKDLLGLMQRLEYVLGNRRRVESVEMPRIYVLQNPTELQDFKQAHLLF